MKTHAIIVAAGKGERAGGGIPKQRQMLGGKPVFLWSVQAFLAADAVERIVLVVPIGEVDLYRAALGRDRVNVTEGGASRTASVLNGLETLDAAVEDKVLIHDAARPGLDQSTITALIGALEEADAAAPALPVIDALKRQIGAQLETVARDELYRVQTPQAFRVGEVRKALEALTGPLVDDLAAIEQAGGSVKLVEGREALSKITWPGDLARMETELMQTVALPKVGTGFDVHAFAEGDHVTLCGIQIPHDKGLAGHSDADVAWHALTDAILGALALGDIGDHFPPSDPQWKGAPSSVFLKHAVSLAQDRGFGIGNCDLTLICEAPKVKPHREAMRQATADLLGIPLDAVSVKATTTEGLGFTGRREGIAAQAVAVLSPLPASS
jgi:2-C-methyl-D-erythritol 4-phosphate cytidylyltransferase/2-C-methyl-D-erythritol 2,4-cyclodiphosphate synthase